MCGMPDYLSLWLSGLVVPGVIDICFVGTVRTKGMYKYKRVVNGTYKVLDIYHM